MTKSDRNAKIFVAHRRGVTFAALARAHGISDARARQIYVREELMERRRMKQSLAVFFEAARYFVSRHGVRQMNEMFNENDGVAV